MTTADTLPWQGNFSWVRKSFRPGFAFESTVAPSTLIEAGVTVLLNGQWNLLEHELTEQGGHLLAIAPNGNRVRLEVRRDAANPLTTVSVTHKGIWTGVTGGLLDYGEPEDELKSVYDGLVKRLGSTLLNLRGVAGARFDA